MHTELDRYQRGLTGSVAYLVPGARASVAHGHTDLDAAAGADGGRIQREV